MLFATGGQHNKLLNLHVVIHEGNVLNLLCIFLLTYSNHKVYHQSSSGTEVLVQWVQNVQLSVKCFLLTLWKHLLLGTDGIISFPYTNLDCILGLDCFLIDFSDML